MIIVHSINFGLIITHNSGNPTRQEKYSTSSDEVSVLGQSEQWHARVGLALPLEHDQLPLDSAED